MVARGVDICVEAGAGTGKTRVLTERVVGLVTEDGHDLGQILAITFTTKAAQEMKVRLADALLARGVTTAREDVESAPISTIHAFCARLLRDHAVEAHVDPGFVVMDERQADRALREALAALVAELARDTPEVLTQLATLPGTDPDQTLLDLYTAARDSLYSVGEFIRRVPEGPSVSDVLADVRDAVRDVSAARAGASAAWQKKVDAALLAARALPAAVPAVPGGVIPELAGAELDAAALAVSVLGRSFRLHGGDSAQKEAMSTLRDACDAACAVLASVCQRPLREQLARVLERLEVLHGDAKGGGAALDFADLERRALGLLESREDVCEAVRARHAEVLVDEFQDTSPVQARLLDCVSRPGALFVVGDPKQSIYGFRGADVDVFLERLEKTAARAPEGGLVVRLDESYRARPAVTAFVNHVFRDGLSRADADAGVRGVPYAPLRAPRAFAPVESPEIEVFQCACDNALAGREAEAAWIAERIVALVAGKEPLRLAAPSDADPLATRAAEFGDVAILLRATTNVKLLERELTARDVPYLVVKGRGFYEAVEIVDLGNLLACVDDPTDDVRLAAVLRSPCCGISDDGLFALTSLRGRRLLVDAFRRAAAKGPDDPELGLSAGDALRLQEFWGHFAALRAERSREPLAILVDHALSRTRLDVLVLARPNGRQRAANLRKARELAIAADRAGDIGLREFAASLREMREREVRETEAPVAGAVQGAVSIMTVHASKGLEFPVVVVPDLAREETSRSGAVVSHAMDGVGMKGGLPFGHPLADVAPREHTWIKARNAARESAEGQRVLYVALTRAEERLILTCALPSGRTAARPWWERIAAALPQRAASASGSGSEAGAGAEIATDVPQDLVLTATTGADDEAPTRVRLHAASPSSESSGPTLHALMDGIARTLAKGRVPALPVPPEAAAAAATLVAEAARTAPPADGTLYATTVSALVAFARCPEEYRRRHLLGIPESLELALALDGDPGSEPGSELGAPTERAGIDDEWGLPLSIRAKGRAAHLALERLAPGFEDDVATVVEAALRTETGDAAPSPDDVAEIAEWVRGFADGDVGRALRGVPRTAVRREQAVLLRTGRTVVRGQIDLLFHDADGWTIVDYKAGKLKAADDAYALQMRLYSLALRGVTGEVPQRTLLWSLPDARAVDVAAQEDDIADLEAGLLAAFARATAVGDYAPPPERPCFNCAYRASCSFSLVGV